MTAKIEWKIEKRKLSALRDYPRNPRKLTKKGLADLENSIRQFGVAEPIVINTDGMICGGHGRRKVLAKMKVKEVDCYVPSRGLSLAEFAALNVRLNKNISGTFDMDILSADFEPADLMELGFEPDDLGIATEDQEMEGLSSEEETESTTCPACGHVF